MRRHGLRLREERGFTLTELLVAMSVGSVLLMAAMMLLDRSFSASGQIADRQDALQRGRQTMERMSQQLRSQVCLGTTNAPVVAADEFGITFYSDLTASPQNTKKRTLTFDPTGRGSISETVLSATSGTYPALVYPASGTPVTMLTKVQRIIDSGPSTRPFFRYYGYKTTGPAGVLEQLSSPVSPSNLRRVALIKIGFRVFADRELVDEDANSTVLESDVYVRVADPNQTQNGAVCI